MEPDRPSQTSTASALMRAAHLLLDAPPYVLEDRWALLLSGWTEAGLRAGLAALEAKIAVNSSPDEAAALLRVLRATTLSRARYVEDELEARHREGCRQLVILGAGLDSYALRTRLEGLRIYEVDHPATQALKLGRLAALGQARPPAANYLPLDLQRDGLLEALLSRGYSASEPAFVSWLGVTNYLPPAAIAGTLGVLSRSPGPVEVVFDYVLADHLLDTAGRRLVATLLADMSARGEPGRSFFEPAALEAEVRSLGFSDTKRVGPEELNRRYFAGRSDSLCLPDPCPAHLIHARKV